MRTPFFRLSPISALMALMSIASVGTALALPASTSSYATDPQNSFVQDQTSEAIEQVNQIACLMSAMAPAKMVNQGPYVALVNEQTCDSSGRSDASASSDASTGGNQAAYMRAILDSTRTDNTSSMRVKTWVEMDEGGQASTIFINTVAAQAPTETNPYGIFRLDYASPNPQDANAPMMQGYIDASSTGLTYVERSRKDHGGGGGGGGGGSSGPIDDLTKLVLHSNGVLSGSGAATLPDHSGGSSAGTRTFGFAYDSDYFRLNDGTADRCFSRKLTDAKSSVWRYGVYDGNTGARIDVKSGFPISATINNQVYHGFMGYYGLSFPSSVMNELTTGKTVTRFEGNTTTNFTLQLVKGRLTRYTKKTRTLNSIDKLPFQFFAHGTLSGLPNEAMGKMLQATWDDATDSFIIAGSVQCGENGCRTKDFETPVSISGTAMASQVFGGMHGFSPSLGGDLFIPTAAMSDGTQNVFYRESQLIYPNDPEMAGKNFHCVSNCLTSTSMTNFMTQQSNTPYGNSSNNFQPVTASGVVTYQMSSQGELENNGSAAVWTGTQEALQGTQFMHGLRSGRLVTDLEALQCEANGMMGMIGGNNGGSNMNSNSSGNETHYCDWKADGAESYYIWETGPNAWNQFAGLKNEQNQLVTFDAPKRFNYTVPSNTEMYGEFAGRTITLEYGGFGQLHGIPGKCVNPKDNTHTSCDGPNARYVPAFSIPDTETEGTVSDEENNHYLVKWLDREIRFKNVDSSFCSTLTVGNTAELPDTSGLKNPSSSSSDIFIGEKPDLTSAPRVIHDVVQY